MNEVAAKAGRPLPTDRIERGPVRRATALGRTSAVVLALGLVTAALTGCSSDPNADCGTALPSGKASELVSATGKIGSAPKVKVPSPIDTTKSERSILTEGRGTQIHRGDSIELTYTVVDGSTGQVAGQSSTKQWYPLGTDAISKGLQCATVGSRVAIVLSPKDGGSQDGSTSPVYVIDVVKSYLSAANGAVRPSVSGFPTVVLAPTGQPGITIPSSGSAPKKVRSEVLKAGDGATVKKDSQVVLNYTAVGWENKNVATSSWTNGAPDLADMKTGQSNLQSQSQSALPQDMLGQLVGQKVGSQLVIETPASNGFPAAAWVVDILGVR